jgi:hypothetical protein
MCLCFVFVQSVLLFVVSTLTAAAAAGGVAAGGFGAGRTLWGATGMGAWSHEGRKPLSAAPLPPPRAADPAALRVATTAGAYHGAHTRPFLQASFQLFSSLFTTTEATT